MLSLFLLSNEMNHVTYSIWYVKTNTQGYIIVDLVQNDVSRTIYHNKLNRMFEEIINSNRQKKFKR